MSHLRTVLWTHPTEPSTEYCVLSEIEAGYQFNGLVVMSQDAQPLRLEYQIITSWDWRTQSVALTLQQASRDERLVLRVDADQRWWRNDEEVTECRGCIDVDLSFSPATNTLPIRRMALNESEHGDTITAWVQLPDLKIDPYPQRYTRTGEQEYLFASLDDDFKARLLVDDLGLVMDYEGLWRAAAQAS